MEDNNFVKNTVDGNHKITGCSLETAIEGGTDEDTPEVLMREAVRLASHSVALGGGPFGAVVVCNGEIIGRGYNRVTLKNDPTAHAEMEAIRDACANRADFHLPDCDLYTSAMPCPMCLSAVYWAKIPRVFYAASAEEAAAAGFLDEFLFKELSLPLEQRSLPLIHMPDDAASEVFRQWLAAENRVDY